MSTKVAPVEQATYKIEATWNPDSRYSFVGQELVFIKSFCSALMFPLPSSCLLSHYLRFHFHIYYFILRVKKNHFKRYVNKDFKIISL